jgi:hypothetical protein
LGEARSELLSFAFWVEASFAVWVEFVPVEEILHSKVLYLDTVH